jgi:hypothetical protein
MGAADFADERGSFFKNPRPSASIRGFQSPVTENRPMGTKPDQQVNDFELRHHPIHVKTFQMLCAVGVILCVIEMLLGDVLGSARSSAHWRRWQRAVSPMRSFCPSFPRAEPIVFRTIRNSS